MNQGSTIFLRVAVLLIGLVVLALCIFALPAGIREAGAGGLGIIFWGMYATAIPFFVALFQALKLLSYIDNNQAFSNASVKALRIVKYCALIISAVYMASLPYFYMVADVEDAPGVMVIGLVLAFAPLVIAVFVAVLQKLLQNAIAIKSEHDLTV